jgi:hypothetical protein
MYQNELSTKVIRVQEKEYQGKPSENDLLIYD